jgi:alpha-beta hydrolase superfamily lysophospholipase
VDKYLMDPLCGFIFPVNGFQTLFELIDRLQDPKNLQNVPKNLPLLIVSGEEDPVGDYGMGPKLTLESLQKYGVEDVTLKLYPGLRHEILNEDAREEVKEDLYQWMMSKI